MERPSIEARKYIGKTEILGNQGFNDPTFEAEMKQEGWLKGYAWCMILARVVYVNCYPEKSAELRRLFMPGVLNTYRNLKNAAYPVGHMPQIDSLVIWAQVKDGKETGFGHAGICTALIENGFKSVEGNTITGAPGEREGYIVAENSHKIAEKGRINGLRIKAFVHIPKPIILHI